MKNEAVHPSGTARAASRQPANALNLRASIAAFGALAMTVGAGCAPAKRIPLVYQIDVQQGNIITQEMLAMLEPGIDKAKVRFIMGTPLLMDAFHHDRWDYVYSLQKGGGDRVQRRVALFFTDNRLQRVEGDVKPASGAIAVEPRRDVSVDVPGEERSGLMARLKNTVGLGEQKEANTSRPQGTKRKSGKGFFRTLKERIGLGSGDKPEHDKGSPPYQDPTNPEGL
ncbi:MAG: outer membrane protein assembly factor BamE [Gammaproteobacteria bacterium]